MQAVLTKMQSDGSGWAVVERHADCLKNLHVATQRGNIGKNWTQLGPCKTAVNFDDGAFDP